ncbi:hypothetical protein C882_0676 [Caenispirillum salinarum AK4]|uniref:CsbD-like domain-containing protein n=1 Tax=Caenispirillum salinarum AK4 TaxID=1238182 RepID=K9HEI1_9PROT|nr:CsbD family protein [Caenispirillum salinarum]EKV28913.1 hypothetical protein C882_0676 [Caenispirillum salinarum AK4]
MDEDRSKGKAKDIIGTGKEMAGKATDKKDLERKGEADQVEGKTQEAVGKAKEDPDKKK